MKSHLLFTALLFGAFTGYSQLTNFDADGKKTKIDAEKIVILVETKEESDQAAPAFVTVLSSLIGVGTGAIQAHLSSKQESYTATYTGRISGKNFMVKNSILTISGLKIIRLTKTGNNAFDTSAIIKLKVIQDDPVFKFETESINITKSKARIKKGGKNGKTIDLNIDIKVDASWRKYEMEEKEEGEKKEKVKKIKSATLESGTLGQSSITLTGIKPGQIENEKISSEWFKMVPQDAANIPAETRGRGWYTITVTVKEANPYGVTSKKIAEFFKESNEAITGFLQSLVPEKSEKKEEEGTEN